MKITELEWLMDNRDIIDNPDYTLLQSYDVFNQYDKGELHQNLPVMLEVFGLVIELYEKYTSSNGSH